jgi:hypothetical protein
MRHSSLFVLRECVSLSENKRMYKKALTVERRVVGSFSAIRANPVDPG